MKKSTAEKIVNILSDTMTRYKEDIWFWYDYWEDFQAKAEMQYVLGNNEQWEAYVEKIYQAERIILKKYCVLDFIDEILKKTNVTNS